MNKNIKQQQSIENEIVQIKNKIINNMVKSNELIKFYLENNWKKVEENIKLINDNRKISQIKIIIKNNQSLVEFLLNNEIFFHNNLSRNYYSKEFIENINNKYKEISGILIKTITDDEDSGQKNLYFDLNSLMKETNSYNKNQDYYFILSNKKGDFNIEEISPKYIRYKSYLKKLNESKDLSNFLYDIINMCYLKNYQ